MRPSRNPLSLTGVMPYMDPINEVHISQPGLIVIDVAAADDATALAFQQLLADRWATSPALHTTRDPGEPGVRLRCYLDQRQPVGQASSAEGPPPISAPGRPA